MDAPADSRENIYALGMLIWELWVEKKPFQSREEQESTEWDSEADVVWFIIDIKNDVAKGLREIIPHNFPWHAASVVQKCWQEDPEARPKAQEVVDALSVYKIIKLIALMRTRTDNIFSVPGMKELLPQIYIFFVYSTA
jgi:hypothetical protein